MQKLLTFFQQKIADKLYIESAKIVNEMALNKLVKLTWAQVPVVQSSATLTSSLITNSLTVVAKVFSNTLMFLLQKCE